MYVQLPAVATFEVCFRNKDKYATAQGNLHLKKTDYSSIASKKIKIFINLVGQMVVPTNPSYRVACDI